MPIRSNDRGSFWQSRESRVLAGRQTRWLLDRDLILPELGRRRVDLLHGRGKVRRRRLPTDGRLGRSLARARRAEGP